MAGEIEAISAEEMKLLRKLGMRGLLPVSKGLDAITPWDLFAAAALFACMASSDVPTSDEVTDAAVSADAMMAEREKRMKQ